MTEPMPLDDATAFSQMIDFILARLTKVEFAARNLAVRVPEAASPAGPPQADRPSTEKPVDRDTSNPDTR